MYTTELVIKLYLVSVLIILGVQSHCGGVESLNFKEAFLGGLLVIGIINLSVVLSLL